MKRIGAYEAKTHLAKLLDEVERGERIAITRHGVPVAELVPVSHAVRGRDSSVIDAIKKFRKGKRLGKLKIRSLVEEGRRF